MCVSNDTVYAPFPSIKPSMSIRLVSPQGQNQPLCPVSTMLLHQRDPNHQLSLGLGEVGAKPHKLTKADDIYLCYILAKSDRCQCFCTPRHVVMWYALHYIST